MLQPPFTDREYLQSVLKRHGFTPERTAGQNFLIAAEVVEATLALLAPGPHRATELGAGVGPLTQALIGAGFYVRAIERDPTLARLLPTGIPAKKRALLELIVDDLRTVDWTHSTPYQLVGNIPYNLSGLIIRRLVSLTPSPATAVLLLQQEVGERLTATPPAMHLISLAVQLWGQPTVAIRVPADCFWPKPAVASALVVITPHGAPTQLALTTREAVLTLARAAFQQRRKQLGTTLPTILQQPRAAVVSLLAECGINPTQRPQELSVEQWMKLYQTINT